MGIRLADQTVIFLFSILLGALFGILYDLFRISRIAFPLPAVIVAIEDMVFFAVCAVITFFFLLGAIDGHVRVFLIIGEILGSTLYYFTIGQVVMKLSNAIIGAIKAVLRWIIRYLLTPVWRIFYFLISLILKPFLFITKILKKILRKLKFSLKVKRVLLYNGCVSIFKKKIMFRKPKEKKTDDTQTKDAR